MYVAHMPSRRLRRVDAPLTLYSVGNKCRDGALYTYFHFYIIPTLLTFGHATPIFFKHLCFIYLLNLVRRWDNFIATFLLICVFHTDGAMKRKIIYIAAVVVIALISCIPIAYGQEDCPEGAEFIISFDNVVPLAEFLQNIPDPNLTFFRNVLKFTEQEIQTATQSAIEYFNMTFGLDFSETEPNQQGQRIFQNASFSAGKAPITVTTKADRWLVNGNTKSRCFDVRLGWLGVSFLGEQVLHGTYGGTEGRTVDGPVTNAINWLYVWINTCPQSPVVILLKATAPASMTPDGLALDPAVASHHILGSGISLLTLLVQPLPPDQRLARVVLYNSIAFPGDEIP